MMFLQRHLSSAKTRWGGGESPERYECKRKVFCKGDLEPLGRREGKGAPAPGTEMIELVLATKQKRGSLIVPDNSFKSGYDMKLSRGLLWLMGSGGPRWNTRCREQAKIAHG